MLFLVLAYPKLADKDLLWVESIRKAHDKLYAEVVKAHFTFVFPVTIQQEQLASHVKKIALSEKSFKFVLKCATLVDDAFNDYMHVFLVPDEGYSDSVKLHNKLYTGILAPELRLDIPFIPHIGIGNSLEAQECKKLADDLNKENFSISGKIDTLSLVRYEANKIDTIEEFVLSRS